jgi:hypothetical protein
MKQNTPDILFSRKLIDNKTSNKLREQLIQTNEYGTFGPTTPERQLMLRATRIDKHKEPLYYKASPERTQRLKWIVETAERGRPINPETALKYLKANTKLKPRTWAAVQVAKSNKLPIAAGVAGTVGAGVLTKKLLAKPTMEQRILKLIKKYPAATAGAVTGGSLLGVGILSKTNQKFN